MGALQHPLLADHPAMVELLRKEAELDADKAASTAAWRTASAKWAETEATYKDARRQAIESGGNPPAEPTCPLDHEFRRKQVEAQHQRRAELKSLRQETLASIAAEVEVALTERHDALLDEARTHVDALNSLAAEAEQLRSSLDIVARAAGDGVTVPGGRIDVETLIRATRGGSLIDPDNVGADRIRFISGGTGH